MKASSLPIRRERDGARVWVAAELFKFPTPDPAGQPSFLWRGQESGKSGLLRPRTLRDFAAKGRPAAGPFPRARHDHDRHAIIGPPAEFRRARRPRVAQAATDHGRALASPGALIRAGSLPAAR